MPWWGWVIIGVMAVCTAVDWIVIMGVNPRRWRGKQ